MSDPASLAICAGATFAAPGLLAMSFITFLTALALMPSGLSIPNSFRMLQAPCACSCGTKTKRLSAIASQPFCKWPRHEHRSVLVSPSQLKTLPYFELPMPIFRVQLLTQLRMGSHALPVEQGRLAKPAVPRHLRRCTLCGTRALGEERHFVFDCPHFAHTRHQFRSLYQDADGTMQCFVWHKDQKAVCHCLAAMLNLAGLQPRDVLIRKEGRKVYNTPGSQLG